MIGSSAAIVRRNAVWLACLAVALAAVVFGLLTSRPLQYRSEAVIEVTFTSTVEQVLGQQRAYEEPQRRVTTEADLVTSRPVAELAAERLTADGRPSTASELQGRTEATPRVSSNLVEVAATDSTPDGAQAVARAVVESYLAYRSGVETEELEALESNLRTAREDTRLELANTPAGERDAVSARIRSIDQLLDTLRVRRSVDSSTQVLRAEASLPQQPSNGLGTRAALVLALVAGSLLALALVLAREWLQDRVRTRQEVEELTGAPVLGVLRRPRAGQQSRAGVDAGHAPPPSDDERSVRLGLARHFGGRLPATVLLASLPSDARPCLAAARSLAASCAATGQSVLLVSDPLEDERPPSTDELSTGRPDALVRRPVALAGVHEAAATSTRASAGLFDQASPAQALLDVAEAFDLVVIAAPGGNGVDAIDVGPLVGATVPVCALDRTRAKGFRQLVRGLASGGAVVPGVVVTDAGGPRSRLRRPRTGPADWSGSSGPVGLAGSQDDGVPGGRAR